MLKITDFIARFILFLIIFLTIHTFVENIYNYDDTDNKDEKERSGLGLYTDNRTGCQYLSAGLFGGIIKRVDKDGNHICGDR